MHYRKYGLFAPVGTCLIFCLSLQAAACAASAGFFSKTWAYLVIGSLVAFCFAIVFDCAGQFKRVADASRLRFAGKPIASARQLFLGSALTLTALAVAAGLFFHPSENILGNHDQGMYVASGLNIARTGGSTIDLPELNGLDPSFRSFWVEKQPVQFTRQPRAPREYWSLGVGFLLRDQTSMLGPAMPNFPTGFPVLIGSAYVVGGWVAVKCINGLVSLMAVAWLAALAWRWLGGWPALVTAILLVLNPLELWSANRLYAEPLIALFWISIIGSLEIREKSPALTGLAAGAAAGVAFLAKIDAGALAFGLALAWVFKKNIHWRIFSAGAFALTSAVSAAIIWRDGRPYYEDTVHAMFSDKNTTIGIIAVVVILAGLGLTVHRQFGAKFSRTVLVWSIVIPIATVLIFFYFIRPYLRPLDTFFYFPDATFIRSYREATLQRLGWFWTPLGLWAGFLGLIRPSLNVRRRSWDVFVLVGCGALLLFAYDIRCNPIQPYCMRRFFPMVLPLLAIGISAGMKWLMDYSRPGGLLAVFLVMGYCIFAMRLDWRLCRRAEHGGMIEGLSSVAEKLPADALVLAPVQSPLGALSIPLRCMWGRDVWILHYNKSDTAFAHRLTAWLKIQEARKRRVYFLDTSENFRFGLPVKITNEAIVEWSTSWEPGSRAELSFLGQTQRWRCAVNEWRP